MRTSLRARPPALLYITDAATLPFAMAQLGLWSGHDASARLGCVM